MGDSVHYPSFPDWLPSHLPSCSGRASQAATGSSKAQDCHPCIQPEVFKVAKNKRDDTVSFQEFQRIGPGPGGPTNTLTSHFAVFPTSTPHRASLQKTWTSVVLSCLITILETKKQVWGGDVTPPSTIKLAGGKG